MIIKKNLNVSLVEIFLIFSYIICWVSISTSLNDFLNFIDITYFNLNNIINFLRQSLNLIIFPILLIVFFYNIKNIIFKNELIFLVAFAYFFLQIPGLILTDNSMLNIGYVISSMNILFIFVLANIYFDKKKYIVFFYITLFMLFLIIILNYGTILNFLISESSQVLYLYFDFSENFFGKHSPRSTGSSRTFLLIMIILNLVFYQFLNERLYLKYIIYIIVATFILLFQSRTTIALLVIFLTINYFFERNYSLKKLIKYFIVYFIMPIIMVYTVLIIKQVTQEKNLFDLKNKEINVPKNLIEITKDFKRPINQATFTSGRFNDWESILSNMDESIIFGYGAQGDRFLINQSASNGIIYATASSGFLGLLFFIFFSLFSFLILSKNFLYFIKTKQIEYYYSSIVVILLLLRSILESSYAVFSVDFIVIYTFISYLNNFLKRKKNGN